MSDLLQRVGDIFGDNVDDVVGDNLDGSSGDEVSATSAVDAGRLFGMVTALRLIAEDLERLAGECESAELRETLRDGAREARLQHERLASIPWTRLRRRGRDGNDRLGRGDSWRM